MYTRWFKRWFDVGLSGLLLLLGAPLWLLLAGLVRWRLGKPIFFKQYRAGRHSQPFQLYKFRTMTDQRDAAGQLLPDGERLTKFGKFLRRTSLDEVPQLLNIFKGDMSFIGPRPLLIDYLPLYSQRQIQRHQVRPGLTGLAQVKGRNAIDWETKFDYDLAYTQQLNWRLDNRILWATARKVLKQSDISASDHATMAPFEGSESENEKR